MAGCMSSSAAAIVPPEAVFPDQLRGRRQTRMVPGQHEEKFVRRQVRLQSRYSVGGDLVPRSRP